MKFLLDTNIISELIAPRPNPRVVEWIERQDPQQIYLSVITLGEIRKGIEKLEPSKRKNTLQTWLENDLLLRFHGRIAEIDAPIMLRWGALMGRLEKSGRSIHVLDALIAAIALEGQYILVTRNDQDFEHTGAAIFNPYK